MKRVRLQHLAAVPITNGLGLSGEHDNQEWPRYVRTTDIETPRTLRSDVFASQPPEVAARATLQRGDIVATAAGATIGKSTLYLEDRSACYAGFLVRFRANEQTDPRFVSYWMQSAEYWAQIETGAVRSTIDNFSASKYRALLIPLFALEEQRRIADFLDDRVARIDQIITARKQQSAAMVRMSHARLSALLDEVGTRYGLAPLRRFCGGMEQGSSPVSDDRPAEPGEPGVIKTSAIQSGTFRAEQNKVMPPSAVDPRYLIRSGDLLVTRGSGSADLVGDAAVAVVPDDMTLYLSDLTYRVRLLQLDPIFASLNIISARGRAELGARVRQGSGPAKARGEDILSIPVPAAPPADQSAVARQASGDRTAMERRRQQLDLSIARLSEYKQSLITAAVSGELDVVTAGSGIPG